MMELTLAKALESSSTVRFQDCDPFGHFNNPRYIDYFINAQLVRMANAYGVNLYTGDAATVANWVVKKSQIAYVRPAKLAEVVRIGRGLIHFDERTNVVETLMLDETGQQLKALCWIEFAYVSLTTGRPTMHEPEWMRLLDAVCLCGDSRCEWV